MTKVIGIVAILSTALMSALVRRTPYRALFGAASVAATALGWWRVRPGAEECGTGACTVYEWRASRRLMAFTTAGALSTMVAGIAAGFAETRIS